MPPQFPIPREEPTGPGYLNGGGHGGGGMPPGSTVAERLTRLEVQVEALNVEMQGVKGLASNVVTKVAVISSDQGRMFDRMTAQDNALERIVKKLEHTVEDTGSFRINTALQQAANATSAAKADADKARSDLAKAEEAARHYTRFVIATIVGMAVVIVLGGGAALWHFIISK